MADVFFSGTDGRVKVANVIIGGLTGWTLEGQTAIIKIPHYEGPTDSYSRMWTPKLFGLSDGQGTVEGYWNNGTDAATGLISLKSDYVFPNGTSATLSLILFKGTAFGFSVNAVLSNFRTQSAIENQPAKFTANFEVNGVLALATTGV